MAADPKVQEMAALAEMVGTEVVVIEGTFARRIK